MTNLVEFLICVYIICDWTEVPAAQLFIIGYLKYIVNKLQCKGRFFSEGDGKIFKFVQLPFMQGSTEGHFLKLGRTY